MVKILLDLPETFPSRRRGGCTCCGNLSHTLVTTQRGFKKSILFAPVGQRDRRFHGHGQVEMIASLTGMLRRKATNYLIVDVAGVGYQVSLPLSTYCHLPNDGEVTLYIHTHVREDSLALFGFLTEAEKELFLLLLGNFRHWTQARPGGSFRFFGSRYRPCHKYIRRFEALLRSRDWKKDRRSNCLGIKRQNQIACTSRLVPGAGLEIIGRHGGCNIGSRKSGVQKTIC